MCGILGCSWQDERFVRESLPLIRHRGPDGEGVFSDGSVSLGHVRLSILGVTEAGRQPMSYEHLTIVFNGEIYNFREIQPELERLGYSFSTGTDTEVILKAYHAWGCEMVRRFNGMWAFCIYDARRNELFLSRDRFGQKPLYYTRTKRGLAFSSEIKPLLKLRKPKVNREIVSDFLYFGFLEHTDETFFKGVKEVPASHHAVFSLSRRRLRLERYYTLKDSQEGVRDAFARACLYRTVADVPVTLSVSGGVDSTAIGAVYARQGMSLEAFTTSSKWGRDETSKVRLLERRYPRAFNVHKVGLDHKGYLGLLRKLVWHLESPMKGDASTRWFIAQAVRSRGYKVLVTGEGGDEMLGGYPSAYPFIVSSLARQGRLGAACRTLRDGWGYIRLREAGFLGYYLAPRWLKRLLIAGYARVARRRLGYKVAERSSERLRNSHFSSSREYFEYGLWRGGVPLLLAYNDKIAMAHGVEARSPFMDVSVAERLMSLDPHERVGHGYTKYVFRKAMEKDVPKRIVWDKTKIGFESPLSRYLKGADVKEAVEEYFAEARCAPYVDAEKFLENYRRFVETGRGDPGYLLKVISLEVFLREFF